MSDEKILKNKLFEIIADYCGFKKDELDLSLDFYEDLACAGDDFFELIEKICIKFDIDCKDFNPYDITITEGLNFVRSIWNLNYLYCVLFDKEKVKIPTFTIGMLLKAIKSRKLKSIKPEGYFYAKEVIVE